MQVTSVRKRSGDVVAFDVEKIRAAVRGAWTEVEGTVDAAEAERAVRLAVKDLPDGVGVEEIQDAVEVALMRIRRFAIARAYIVYRERRAELRGLGLHPDPVAVSDYIHASKYARHVPELGRREVFDETVARVEMMHQRKFAHIPSLRAEVSAAFDLVRAKRVLPSMRGMQFGGAAVEVNNARQYNCSASLVDRPRVFAETMFLLLSGCGTGYSVQFDHVEKLPALAYVDPRRVVHHVVGDQIEGWADAVDALVNSYLDGTLVEFAFHEVRGAGSLLKTSGGRAPGHLRLKLALERIRDVLHGAQGRQLRPLECHKIMCHIADAVLSGGIRRSAMIALFSLDDSEMMNCKSDSSWFVNEPWFANANNSVVLKRDEVTHKQFDRIFSKTRHYGEPGFMFVDDHNEARNPCAEILLEPRLVNADGTESTGWATCNLCEINAAKLTSFEDFVEVAHAATLIGTLQASYTDMPYLGPVTEAIVRRDALLGIGMTGIQDRPDIALNPEYQRKIAAMCVAWNAEYAALIGINPAARVMTVKPSGTTSLELGSVASGIHPHHAKRYIRRVTADELEVVFQAFRAKNPKACTRKPDGKWVIEFPVEAPDGATLREDLGALQFLEIVRSTQQNWVVPGTVRGTAHHNVSNTITVRDEEWGAVAEYLWEHRADFAGVSLLSDSGDTVYPFAPFEAVKTEAQQRRWNELIANYVPVDYLALLESEDGTALIGEAACAGGSCER